tara:strand:- start:24 stop:317 length:294 start_codon:yes stop_codon:yes gene_type:complete
MIRKLIFPEKQVLNINLCKTECLETGDKKFGFVADYDLNRHHELDYSSEEALKEKFPTKDLLIKHVVNIYMFEDFNFFDKNGILNLPEGKEINVRGY